MIGLFALNYNIAPEEVLRMTLQNVLMYNAVIPSYSSDKDDKNKVINVTSANKAEVEKILGL